MTIFQLFIVTGPAADSDSLLGLDIFNYFVYLVFDSLMDFLGNSSR